MNTERHDVMRVVLHGCSHRPKVSAMVSPKQGDFYFCGTCRRRRVVVGAHTTWAYATIVCLRCKYQFRNNGSQSKKKIVSSAIRHANARGHVVEVMHDGVVDVVRPEGGRQLPLIDDLLLP